MPHNGPVIIVEDDEDDQQLMRDTFGDLGIKNELLFFKEGGAFLQYLRATPQQPFIIITDVNLPLCKKIYLVNCKKGVSMNTLMIVVYFKT